MIVWKDRHGLDPPVYYGFLVRRFDNYIENKIASRNYSPSWAWEIRFTPFTPYNYSLQHGCAEINLLNGNHGKIYRPDGTIV